ncbi:MAG: pyridoxal phosphate-dependent aminotransferase [Thermoplasmata archaeon]|nr:pyridoxal phosphate-dependent aminotransferase [Thermoplasmata archaeon]
MFSSRTRWDRAENRLARAIRGRRGRGEPLLDLTESNPTRVGLQAPADLLERLADRGSLSYAPEPRGAIAAREAVADDTRRRGVAVSADQVLLTASTSEAYALAFKLLCDPGDAVLVPRPSYPLFDFLADLESVRVDNYPLVLDGTWHLDLDEIRRALSPETRAIVVVNPNNPTGSFLKQDEADALLALCGERGLAVISDEVFADYAFVPDERRVIAMDGGDRALVLSFGGLSKSCGLPQLKLGWVVVTGPAALRDEALARLEIAADTYLSVGTPVQHAAPRILARLPELRAPIAARVGSNLGVLRHLCHGDLPANLLDAEGGWCAVVRVPATVSEDDRVCRLVQERGVLVHPGYFFDFTSGAHVVVSLLPEPETFRSGVEILLASL